MHSFAGSDSVRAFAGKGEKIADKLLKGSTLFQEAFGLTGAKIKVSIYVRYDFPEFRIRSVDQNCHLNERAHSCGFHLERKILVSATKM